MPEKPFRVLSLDGGGMRGAYTATYLSTVAAGFARQRGAPSLDVGAGFDLIVGTSVGGIVACALAANVPLARVVDLFRSHGSRFFPRKVPARVGLSLIWDLFGRPAAIRSGNDALRDALRGLFGDTTLTEVYARRRVALAITAVELHQHRSWIFKTPHLAGSNRRDDGCRLVDVCLATSAAPIFRSLAALDHPDDGPSGCRVFADGGLWANNPVLVALIEALRVAQEGTEIQIFCLGTCPRTAGERISKTDVHRGLAEWGFGGRVAPLAIDAQEAAFDCMARLIKPHLNRRCEIVRFPSETIPAALAPYLDLDDTRSEAFDILINQARSDADITNSLCQNVSDPEGQLIRSLFSSAPLSR